MFILLSPLAAPARLNVQQSFPSAYDAVLLSPCNAVHTMFMRYSIDVVLKETGQVAAVYPLCGRGSFPPL